MAVQLCHTAYTETLGEQHRAVDKMSMSGLERVSHTRINMPKGLYCVTKLIGKDNMCLQLFVELDVWQQTH